MPAPSTLDAATIDSLTAIDAPPDTPASIFTFRQPRPEQLILDGALGGHALFIDAPLCDRDRFLLVSRGLQFDWIQERPFNR